MEKKLKKQILQIFISNYYLTSNLLENNYNQWIALKAVNVGDYVYEKTSIFLVIRKFNEQNYDESYALFNRSCGVLQSFDLKNNLFTIETADGNIVNWNNCEFMKFQME